MNQYSAHDLASHSPKLVVSVVMPVYNTELGLVDRALTSICRQTHGKLQVIVVDDG
jgi:glycosyltransferase involved in cell wall biosynthesis